jgi:hypothetical protein
MADEIPNKDTLKRIRESYARTPDHGNEQDCRDRSVCQFSPFGPSLTKSP